MELPNYPKNEYLLDASLQSLHEESVAWLKDLEFWSDEMAFFYKLLHRKESKKSFPSAELAIIEKELVKLNSEKLDYVRANVVSHERLLTSVSLSEEQIYHETHRELINDMYNLYLDVRNFKKKIFSFIDRYES